MSEVKPFYLSKTFWFNVVSAVVVIATMIGYNEFTPDPQLMALIQIVGNIALRFVTKQPIALTLD